MGETLCARPWKEVTRQRILEACLKRLTQMMVLKSWNQWKDAWKDAKHAKMVAEFTEKERIAAAVQRKAIQDARHDTGGRGVHFSTRSIIFFLLLHSSIFWLDMRTFRVFRVSSNRDGSG